jgi:hypothetical protein
MEISRHFYTEKLIYSSNFVEDSNTVGYDAVSLVE